MTEEFSEHHFKGPLARVDLSLELSAVSHIVSQSVGTNSSWREAAAHRGCTEGLIPPLSSAQGREVPL